MASTANLTKALAQGTVIVKKTVSGEVRIQFYNSQIEAINLNHNFPENLMTHVGVTPDACRKSNLNSLVASGFIKIIL